MRPRLGMRVSLWRGRFACRSCRIAGGGHARREVALAQSGDRITGFVGPGTMGRRWPSRSRAFDRRVAFGRTPGCGFNTASAFSAAHWRGPHVAVGRMPPINGLGLSVGDLVSFHILAAKNPGLGNYGTRSRDAVKASHRLTADAWAERLDGTHSCAVTDVLCGCLGTLLDGERNRISASDLAPLPKLDIAF